MTQKRTKAKPHRTTLWRRAKRKKEQELAAAALLQAAAEAAKHTETLRMLAEDCEASVGQNAPNYVANDVSPDVPQFETNVAESPQDEAVETKLDQLFAGNSVARARSLFDTHGIEPTRVTPPGDWPFPTPWHGPDGKVWTSLDRFFWQAEAAPPRHCSAVYGGAQFDYKTGRWQN